MKNLSCRTSCTRSKKPEGRIAGILQSILTYRKNKNQFQERTGSNVLATVVYGGDLELCWTPPLQFRHLRHWACEVGIAAEGNRKARAIRRPLRVSPASTDEPNA